MLAVAVKRERTTPKRPSKSGRLFNLVLEGELRRKSTKRAKSKGRTLAQHIRELLQADLDSAAK